MAKFHAENQDLEKSAPKEGKKLQRSKGQVPVQNFLDDLPHQRGFWVQTDFPLVLQGGSAEGKRG